jgi:hypothetical protein
MTKSLHFTFLVALVALVVGTGCVDKNYEIKSDEIDLEAQFAAGGIDVKIGFFEPKNLGEMLLDVEGLSTDEDGYYYLHSETTTQLSFFGGEIPEIDPIDLSQITDYLDEKIASNLVPPSFTFAFDNSLSTAISVGAILTTKGKDGSEIITLTAPFTLLPSEDGVTPRTTHIFVANDDVPFPNDGNTYTRIIPEGFDKLFEMVPSTMEVKFDSNMEGAQFNLNLTSEVDIPLAFRKGTAFVIEMTETGLNGMFSDLADYGVKATQIGASIEVATSIPLTLGGENTAIEFLDTEGGSIEGLKTEITGTVSGPGDGESGVKTSTLSVTIEIPNGGDFTTLKKIDQLRLTLPFDASRTESHLNQNETISGSIYLSLPKGITFDMDVF